MDGGFCGASLIGMHEAGVAVGHQFGLPERELAWLLTERSVAWLGHPVATSLATILRRITNELTTSAWAGCPPLVITNKIFSHIYRSAELWGGRHPRERAAPDAHLPRGTLTTLGEAFRASFDVLRPGGSIVVHVSSTKTRRAAGATRWWTSIAGRATTSNMGHCSSW